MNRRSFLKGLLSFLGFLWGCVTVQRLSSTDRETLAAAAARLLPSDDGPGAAEAGVVDYIENALAHPYHRALREPFRRGAALLNELAQKDWKKPFAALSAQDQDSILSYLESGRADTPDFPASRFLDRLLTLTLEGFLGDPCHGGNRNHVGWKYIGFTPGEPRCRKGCGH